MKEISAEEAVRMGVTATHTLMDNGERRNDIDGSGYARTESSNKGGWQNSHYHKSLREMFIVQKGWAIFVEQNESGAEFKLYKMGDYFVSTPGVPHNQYLSSNSVTHFVKFGENIEADWIGAPELDKITKSLSEEDVLKIVDNK